MVATSSMSEPAATSHVVTRSMSDRGETVRQTPIPHVPKTRLRRRIITRSMSKKKRGKAPPPKRKYPTLMPASFFDSRRPIDYYNDYEGYKEMLWRKHKEKLRTQATGRKVVYVNPAVINEAHNIPRDPNAILFRLDQIQEFPWATTLDADYLMLLDNRILPPVSFSTCLERDSESLWETLDLHGMNNAGDLLLAAFSLPVYQCYLKHINLKGAQDIEDKHLTLLKRKIETIEATGVYVCLESINLDCCKNISDIGLEQIASVSITVLKFSMMENSLVTDSGIERLVNKCHQLEDLNLSGCRNITDKSLVALSKNCVHLESLDISRCEHVTDDGVIAVSERCPMLLSLSLSGICGVTARGLKNLDTMVCLDVTNCNGIELSAQELLQLFPNSKFSTLV